ncbi:MAG: AAA family ATPase [Clostridia bacterium]|nr:AAA family ATPase [Clostridia bacterium]
MEIKELHKGKAAYKQMSECCDQLVASGNWQRVGTSDIRLFLDMYVQSLLLKLAQAGGTPDQSMLTYIASVPARDILQIGKATPEQALNIGFKNRSFAEGTPLLLRCCQAMDDKDGTAKAQQFVDGVSRLLYAAAEVDGDLDGKELQFITTYAGGLRTFLMTRAAGRHAGMQEQIRMDAPGSRKQDKPEKNAEKKPVKAEPEEKSVEELVAELDGLIGLTQVKKEVHTLINLIKVRKMREEHDLKVMDMSFHMVFTGNPGTGKTTVARLVAKIYKQLGFLSQGQLIETDRSGLVAGYVGQTAGKVTEVVNSALGGILFIDEAYALARKGMDNDFGHEAIDTLVKLMEDHRDDLVVIVAGYTDLMHDFLTSNPGLISRFNKYIDFPDYTDDELMGILEMNAKKQGYKVTDEAKKVIRGMLQGMTMSDRMDFGNARGMRNTLEKLVQEQANRLAETDGEITKDMLIELNEADARAALYGEQENLDAASDAQALMTDSQTVNPGAQPDTDTKAAEPDTKTE